MQYPSRAVADLVRWATQFGCTYMGVARSGHVKILLPNGETYTTSATPSDRRATQNARRAIAKKLGIQEQRPRAGRYKGGSKQTAHTPATVRVESVSARYAKLAKQHRILCDAIANTKRDGHPDAADKFLAELVDVEVAIVKLGRRAPLRTFRA